MKLIIIISLLVLFAAHYTEAELFPLSIIHINDFHARFEPTDTTGGTCDAGDECIGGYARTVYTVKRLMEEHKDHNPVYFNAGDSFQGTLWYNIGRWNVTSEFLNMLPADAMTLGNHEFDHGIEGLVPFLEHIKSPMLVANMDSVDEPTMTGKYQKSMIIERSNRKIGVIGAILETTYDLANTGDLIFYNESLIIREEAQKLKEQGANIIIVITHCGYDVDKLIAQNAGADIDVIVGAHSHTFLFTGENLPGPDTPRGDYPTEVIHSSGHRVLIVQAAAYAKYVGNIRVYFDDNGDIVSYEGAPIYMGSDVPEDAAVVKNLPKWKAIVEAASSVKVGESRVDLLHDSCGNSECNLGNFVCDAFIHSFLQIVPYNMENWTNVTVALALSNELRISIPKGDIHYSQLFSIASYEDTLFAFNLAGKHLQDALEHSVSALDLSQNITQTNSFLQMSGLKVVYDLKEPSGQRVKYVKVRCADCKTPEYEPLVLTKMYRIATTRYLARGARGFTMFSDYGSGRVKHSTDFQALLDYAAYMKPVYNGIEGRIKVINETIA